jgi:hypothetical protein
MRTQQQAEKEEQQRIKNLVLNYDLTTDENDGTNGDSNISYLQPNPNRLLNQRPLHPIRFSNISKNNTPNTSSEIQVSRNSRNRRTRPRDSTRQGTMRAINVPENFS